MKQREPEMVDRGAVQFSGPARKALTPDLARVSSHQNTQVRVQLGRLQRNDFEGVSMSTVCNNSGVGVEQQQQFSVVADVAAPKNLWEGSSSPHTLIKVPRHLVDATLAG